MLQDHKRRMAFSDLTDWEKNMWKAGSTLVNPNPDVNSDVSVSLIYVE